MSTSTPTGGELVAAGVANLIAGLRQLATDNPATYAAVLRELAPPAAVTDLVGGPEPYEPGEHLGAVNTSGAGLSASGSAIDAENTIVQGLQRAAEDEAAAVKLAITILMAAAMAAA